MAIPCADMMRL